MVKGHPHAQTDGSNRPYLKLLQDPFCWSEILNIGMCATLFIGKSFSAALKRVLQNVMLNLRFELDDDSSLHMTSNISLYNRQN